jgi:hypothetical protein
MLLLERFGRYRVDDFALCIEELDGAKTILCHTQPQARPILLIREGDARRAVGRNSHLNPGRTGGGCDMPAKRWLMRDGRSFIYLEAH